MDLNAVREGIIANAATTGAVNGAKLTVYAGRPNSITEPAFLIGQMAINYNSTMANGMQELVVSGELLVSTADDRVGWERLSAYLKGTGPTSLRAAIESDQSLGGVASYTTVVNVETDNEKIYAGISYLGADIIISVAGDGS